MSLEELANFKFVEKDDKESSDIIEVYNDIGIPYFVSQEEIEKIFEEVFGQI